MSALCLYTYRSIRLSKSQHVVFFTNDERVMIAATVMCVEHLAVLQAAVRVLFLALKRSQSRNPGVVCCKVAVCTAACSSVSHILLRNGIGASRWQERAKR